MADSEGCFQRLKDTNLKANHNYALAIVLPLGCFQRLKDTNLKANHNPSERDKGMNEAVFNDSKILI